MPASDELSAAAVAELSVAVIEAARLRDTCGVPAAASIVGARLKAHQALRSVILRSTAAAKIPPVILTELETSSVTPSAD